MKKIVECCYNECPDYEQCSGIEFGHGDCLRFMYESYVSVKENRDALLKELESIKKSVQESK
jgi:hypothetical protein